MTIRWITPLLGTAPATIIGKVSDANFVDVRSLVDKAGNPIDVIQRLISEGVESLSSGKRTIICCDYGMSRSNAVAVGILSICEKINFNQAIEKVQEATGEMEIKPAPLNAVRSALGIKSAKINEDRRSILVTGGSGFLGKSLIKAIDSKWHIVAPPRSQLDVSLGSTQLYLLLSKEEVSCVVHLANPRVYTSNIAMGQSITMLRNVIEVCLEKDIKLIYPSGWEIYSGYAGKLLANESTPAFPKGPYGETKYLAELLIEHFRRTRNLKCLIFRSGPVYGIGSDKPKFIFNFINKAKNSETIITHKYKNGDPALDLMHIDDFVSALDSAIKSNFNGNLNIGTGCLTSTKKIAQYINTSFHSECKIKQINIDTDVASIAMDWRKAHDVLKWKPKIPLIEGLEHMFAVL